MENQATSKQSETFENISLLRLLAYTFERVWVLIIFYSIMFYTGSSDVNVVLKLLYTNLSLSMATMGIGFLVVGVILNLLRKVGFRPSKCAPLMIGAAVLMALGALLLIVSDLNSITGAMVLIISALLTGVGSACLMHCFFESFASVGARTTVLEMSVATGIGLLSAFVLITLPPIIADIVIVIAPLCSAVLLFRCAKSDNKELPLDNSTKLPFSRRTELFFGKALAGALILGFIEGFYDGFFGYSPSAATLTYDGTLFVAAFIAVFIIAIISTAAPRDMLFHIYKISLAMFAVACVLSVAMGDNGLYSAALFFSGYTCFVLLLTAVCVEISQNYEINPSLLFGITFFILYMGELLGANCNAAFFPLAMGETAVITCCIVCLFLLFVVSVYLFNELDLVTIGIGEVRSNDVRVASDSSGEADADKAEPDGAEVSAKPAADADVSIDGSAVTEAQEEEPAAPETMTIQEAAELIARDYHLSARESEVLPLLLAGRTISRIQEALYISSGTVSTHIRHIYQKTGVNRKQQLIDLGEQYIQGTALDPASKLQDSED